MFQERVQLQWQEERKFLFKTRRKYENILWKRRRYNLNKKKHLSRITIVTKGTPQVIQQIKLQLGKLVPVHKVADFLRNDPDLLFRELALFKIAGTSSKLDKAKKLCKKYNSFILDKTKKSFVIQVTALRREIDKLTVNLKPLGLISISSTGAVAKTRGEEIFIQN